MDSYYIKLNAGRKEAPTLSQQGGPHLFVAAKFLEPFKDQGAIQVSWAQWAEPRPSVSTQWGEGSTQYGHLKNDLRHGVSSGTPMEMT
jgi:hypothetical protein